TARTGLDPCNSLSLLNLPQNTVPVLIKSFVLLAIARKLGSVTLTQRYLEADLIDRCRTSRIRQVVLADLMATTPARLCRWLSGLPAPRSPEADDQVRELCLLLPFPFAHAFVEKNEP